MDHKDCRICKYIVEHPLLQRIMLHDLSPASTSFELKREDCYSISESPRRLLRGKSAISSAESFSRIELEFRDRERERRAAKKKCVRAQIPFYACARKRRSCPVSGSSTSFLDANGLRAQENGASNAKNRHATYFSR